MLYYNSKGELHIKAHAAYEMNCVPYDGYRRDLDGYGFSNFIPSSV